MLKNSLKSPIIKSLYCKNRAEFKGEIILSGILERMVYNDYANTGVELFFYPEDKFKNFLPFYHNALYIIISTSSHCDLVYNYKCDYRGLKDFNPFTVMLKINKEVLKSYPGC